jgi:DNA-binding SARP family transcriptional activator
VRRAAAAGDHSTALAVARVALARYRGDLLPDERYEAWAATRREGLRRQRLMLLDLCAHAAERAGDLDEAVRLLREGIELDPTDEDRYLQATDILLRQGSRGAARRVLTDLGAVLDDLGVRASARQRDLERSLRA